jgi:hypothetical protein
MPNQQTKQVGQAITHLRKQSHLTQAKVAEQDVTDG